jgi:hypothetical protein
MPGQYSKSTIQNAIKARVLAKGFNLNVQKGEGKGISNTTPTISDIIDVVSDSLSTILSQGTFSANLVAKDFAIGPPGLQQPVATKAIPGQNNVVFDMTTDPTFFTWIETLHSLLQASYPEPGYGAPDVFATALKSLLSLKPTSINGKITSGSSTIKVSV